MQSKDYFEKSRKTTNISFSRYPKMMPSYIVAFSVQETYDDIATAQQMICNKRSLQGSNSSVSPTISSKTLTLDRNSSHKLVDTSYIEGTDEIKINIDEAGDDVHENKLSDNNEDNQYSMIETFETNDYSVVENKEEIEGHIDSAAEDKHHDQLTARVPKKTKNHNKIRNVNFKNKKAVKNEEKRCAASKIKDTLYINSMSKIVSRTTLLKKVVTKENLNELDNTLLSDESNFDADSLQSSPSTIRKCSMSNLSQNTLRQEIKSSSNNDIRSADIKIPDMKVPTNKELPYGKEVVNVSVAVTNNKTAVKDYDERKKSIFGGNFISTDTLVYPDNMMTSESTSSDASDTNAYFENKHLYDPSDKTLTLEGKQPNLDNNTNKTFAIRNTKLDYDNLRLNSDDTLAPNSEAFMFSENLHPTTPVFEKQEKVKKCNDALLDTVINMRLFPEVHQSQTPSTSSDIYFNEELNGVFVTGDGNKHLRNTQQKINNEVITEYSKGVLRKPLENNDIMSHRVLTLPRESTIKTIIKDTDKLNTKYCSGEVGGPTNMDQLWERLVTVVDKAVTRLEESLTERIITEMRKTFATFERNVNTLQKEPLLIERRYYDNKVVSTKEVFVEKDIVPQSDESLQCNLVGNQVIDNLMMQLSVEDPRSLVPESSSKSLQKIIKPKVLRDYFEVLKPPVLESLVVVDKEKVDTITVSTAVASESEAVDVFRRARSFIIGPFMFLRENMLVITSVPAFFVLMLCAYGVIVLIMKPW